ncbi:MAG: phosphotransferase [Planctomycetes bacterium]|nr:phosphotransferase [Planctomycetota bacterium]
MKVLIPTAGIGSRLGGLTAHYNKALLPIGKRPVISHIIDWYPVGTEFIVALGYKGDYIRQFLELAYPSTEFCFVDIDNFDGPGSGLGYTLRLCRPYLDDEFVFHANDTIIVDKHVKFPLLHDTMFLHRGSPDPKRYRTAACDEATGRVLHVYDKTEGRLEGVSDYVGVAYIKDCAAFGAYLDAMPVEIGESAYFMRRTDDDLRAQFIEGWYDIGNVEQYRAALRDLADFNNLNKPDEAIYFRKSKVFKFSTDSEFIRKRVERAVHLEGCVPEVAATTRNFYVYGYVPGEVLANKASVLSDFEALLEWCLRTIWRPIRLRQSEYHAFENTCFQFYYDKTMDRVDAFYSRYNCQDAAESINGIRAPELTRMVEMVDWADLKHGIPVLFHGDLHLENIVRSEGGFVLLDWRQGFGDELRYGDIYYDLAKLLHGLIVNHDIIRNEQFIVEADGDRVVFDFHRKHRLIECERYLRLFVENQDLSWRKVSTLAGLIFLNIAALHHHPYSHLLYYLGKSMLWQGINSGQVGEAEELVVTTPGGWVPGVREVSDDERAGNWRVGKVLAHEHTA